MITFRKTKEGYKIYRPNNQEDQDNFFRCYTDFTGYNQKLFSATRKQYTTRNIRNKNDISRDNDYDKENESTKFDDVDNDYLCFSHQSSVSNLGKLSENVKIPLIKQYTSNPAFMTFNQGSLTSRTENVITFATKKGMEFKNKREVCTDFLKYPVEKERWIRYNLEREVDSTTKKEVYKVYLSEDLSPKKRLIMYALKGKSGHFYFGIGDKYDPNIGELSHMNFLGIMENDFFGKEFLLYIKQSEEKYNILGIEYVKYVI